MERKDFLKTVGALIAGTALSANNFPDLSKNNNEEAESPTINDFSQEDMSEFQELLEFKYPTLEDTPELLRGYASKFSSWPEVAKDQKLRLLDLIKNSSRYKEALTIQFTSYFKNLSKEEVSALVSQLINLRYDSLSRCKDIYGKIIDGARGMYTPEKDRTKFDTLSMGGLNDKDIKTTLTDFFVFAHEYCHATQCEDMMHVGVFADIIRLLQANSTINQSTAEKIRKSVLENKDTKKIINEGRVYLTNEEDFDLERYSQRPSEVMSYLMQIRFHLHVVSETNPELIKFNMHTDLFTKDHLKFLFENRHKIFQSTTSKSLNLKDSTLIDVYLRNFKEDDFIYLMNQF